MPMMATTPDTYRPSSTPYTPVAAHELRRQMSTPAAIAATFATCGSGGGRGRWPRKDGDGDGDGELRGREPRPPAGGVAAVVRSLWAWIARTSSRRKAVMSRSGSSVKEQQYGHEEYAQNFDEGGAAREPENLSRSFSARYARQATWDGARRHRRG